MGNGKIPENGVGSRIYVRVAARLDTWRKQVNDRTYAYFESQRYQVVKQSVGQVIQLT